MLDMRLKWSAKNVVYAFFSEFIGTVFNCQYRSAEDLQERSVVKACEYDIVRKVQMLHDFQHIVVTGTYNSVEIGDFCNACSDAAASVKLGHCSGEALKS